VTEILDAAAGRPPRRLPLTRVLRMSSENLSRMIRDLREKKGLTQEELAFKVKVTSGYVAQLEFGMRTNRSLDVVRWLARALGVPLGKLLE
jgi:transcriptional regulator with XRE-family HTH domain